MPAPFLLRTSAACLAAAVMLVSPPARAQSIDEMRARADALFREGQQLLVAGQIAAACEKLEESQRIDPKIGRLLNLAYCHEKEGRVASAWREYDQAAAMAIQLGQAEREKFAREQASALARRLAFLRLNLEAQPDGTEVSIDGKPVPREQWTTSFAVDPGPHTIAVRAPGFKTKTQTATIQGTGTLRVDVGALEKEEVARAPAAPAAAVPPPDAAPTNTMSPPAAGGEATAAPNSARTVGWIVGGAGVVLLGVGTAFGFDALSLKNQAQLHCSGRLCDPTGMSTIEDAKTAGILSTVGLVAGVVATGAGAWLLLRRPAPANVAEATVAPFVAADRAGVALQGRW
jgi:hypothetical protein